MNVYLYTRDDPLDNTDPDGARVLANYFKDSGIIVAVDLSTGRRAVAWGFSGGSFHGRYGAPVPNGTYAILQGKDSNHYRLERYDAHFGDDATPEGRTELRLHPHGTVSLGCITCSGELGGNDVGNLIEHTQGTVQTTVEYHGRNPFQRTESLTNYGSLGVHSSGDYHFNAQTREVTRDVVPLGSRISRAEHVCTFNDEGQCK